MAFLKQLRRHIPGPMTILWDRGKIHDRSKVVRAYLAEHPEVVTEKFPGYAPETNPDEMVWQHTKHGRLANFTPEDTAELRAELVEEFGAAARQARAAVGVHPARQGPDPVTSVSLVSHAGVSKDVGSHEQNDFGAQSHGFGTRCLRFAARVARHHARLASGCWPSSTGRDWLPAGFQRKVSDLIASPFPKLSWRTIPYS